MGCHSRQDTRVFKRTLSDEQREILLSAGQGDLTIGFHECLALWVAIHPLGVSSVPNLLSRTSSRSQKVKYPGKAPSDSPPSHAESA